MGKIVDITGYVYHKLTVIERLEERKNNVILWLCKCSCGSDKNVITSASSLNSGNTKSCGCYKSEKLIINNEKKKKDITNQKFGKLTAIKVIGKSTAGNYIWECYCDCGNIHKANQGDLHSGNVQSCGCVLVEARKNNHNFKLHSGKNFIDLTGNTFGYLEVISRIADIKKNPVYKCKCKLCGNFHNVKGKLLKNGKVSSCGCLKSKGEEEIKTYLTFLDIEYIAQYQILNCRRINPLPFDFAILDKKGNIKFLIEYDGTFHYQPCGRTKSKIAYGKENDDIKTNFCIDNNISLLRIPYTEKSNKEAILVWWLTSYELL